MMLVDGPFSSRIVTVPVVVGFQLMVYAVPAGTTSFKPGLVMGLQLSVHWLVGVV